jgi:amino acid transporter
MVPPHQPRFNIFGVGLALGLWLYSGYEQCSTVAEEVENPQRSYPLALAIVVPMSIAVYFLPTLASLAALADWQNWHTRHFSDAAAMIGGPWLGAWMTLAAIITNIALLNATVLTSTRMPFAMAEDGYLPSGLTRQHPRYRTPWIAIVVSSIIYAALSILSLTQLISIYSWLRIATTILTVLAGWQLRRKQPDMNRPFLIPGGSMGLIYAVAAPIIMSVVALLGSDRYGTVGGIIGLAVGPVIYFLCRRKPAAAVASQA